MKTRLTMNEKEAIETLRDVERQVKSAILLVENGLVCDQTFAEIEANRMRYGEAFLFVVGNFVIYKRAE